MTKTATPYTKIDTCEKSESGRRTRVPPDRCVSDCLCSEHQPKQKKSHLWWFNLRTIVSRSAVSWKPNPQFVCNCYVLILIHIDIHIKIYQQYRQRQKEWAWKSNDEKKRNGRKKKTDLVEWASIFIHIIFFFVSTCIFRTVPANFWRMF